VFINTYLGAGNAGSKEGQVHLQAPNTGGRQHAAGLASTPGLQKFFCQFGNRFLTKILTFFLQTAARLGSDQQRYNNK
jgi:hypothetical protein